MRHLKVSGLVKGTPHGSHIRKIHKQNYLTRNETNNAKGQYFKDNLELNKKDPRKTWELINELSSRKCGKIRHISQISRIDDKTIKSAPEMAEAFNKFFTTIGPNLQ